MLSFFKKKPSLDEVLDRLKVDLHSHLIPGIDDGAQTLEESIELIKNLSTIGYKKLIITPHIMIDVYKNEEDNIIERLEILKKAINKVGIDIDLEVAAEYYLDEGFLEHLNNKPLLIANKYLLFETSYMAKPIVTTNVPGCKDVVDDGVNGFLCKVKSATSLANSIEKVINLSKEDRDIMGYKSREKVKKEFDEKIVISKYLNAIKDILNIKIIRREEIKIKNVILPKIN